MTSGTVSHLNQRLQITGSSTPLKPISGKCSVTFQSCPEIVHELKHANPTSTNVYTAHFRLDGRLWLWQQIARPGLKEWQILAQAHDCIRVETDHVG